MERIAVIPARGGSSRVPRKNCKLFRGMPMISYPIDSLRKTKLFDLIVVSTDDSEIAELAIKSGADRVIDRPENLADNSVPTVEVISHAVEFLGVSPNSDVCTAYATNPLLRPEIIIAGYNKFRTSRNINYLTSVVKYGFPPQRALVTDRDGGFYMPQDQYMFTNSQDLEPHFHETGQFWWGKASTWLAGIGMQKKLAAIVIPEWIAQDIDDEDDWILAEAKFDFLKLNPGLLEKLKGY